MVNITEVAFKLFVGRYPENDDLERCNCPNVGSHGHTYCGWCEDCSLPVFECGHVIENDC